MRLRFLVSLAIAGGAAACGADAAPLDIADLERPSAIAFACYGDMRVTMGQPADPAQTVVGSAQPVSACRTWLDGGRPVGQEELEGEGVVNPLEPLFVSFVLEPAKGTMAVVVYAATSSGLSTAGVIDTDPLTPGRNPVPVGTLPVGLASSADGCQAVTANSGSCDLSVIDVASVVGIGAIPQVDRVQVMTPGGAHVLARPADLVTGPAGGEVGFTCPDSPQGVVWVAYPDCHAVAAVSITDGTVLSSIRFLADGTAEIGDGELTCMDECGDGAVALGADPTTPRPIALRMAADGQRLYIGAQNRPELTIVDLDAALLATAVGQVAIEGEVGELGLRRLVDTGTVTMGGSLGFLGDGDGGDMEFVYAIASDNTIRVIEVSGATPDTWKECDTQIDPRYLHDEVDVSLLSCIPVGTPLLPRRSSARSPGIHMPRISLGPVTTRDYEGIPLDLAVTTVDRPPEVTPDAGRPCVVLGSFDDQLAASPYCLIGTFVFVSTADGQVFVVNVDDDVYPDVEDPLDPTLVTMPLAVAHQLRDWVSNRDDADGIRESILADGSTNTDDPRFVCSADTFADSIGARLLGDVGLIWNTGVVAEDKAHLLPRLLGQVCTPDGGLGDVVVPELGFGATPDVRERAFPDVHAVRNETWTMVWEGVVSLDAADRVIDGPSTRIGTARREGSRLHLDDASAPFCRAGVDAYDFAVLAGCDPTRGDTQCGIGETCYVHPDTPASIASGMCIDAGDVDELAETCRELLTSRRRYSIEATSDKGLTLMERRRVLSTTPPEGCTDTAQCDLLWERQRALADPAHPKDEALAPPEQALAWSCEADPSRAPGPLRCVMTCATTEDCEEGSACVVVGPEESDRRCVEGPLPPDDCIRAAQRYQLRVSDAFTVLGDSTGFLHNKVRDPDGTCVESATPNPLNIGRLPLAAPPCVGDGPVDLSPNPCSTTVEQHDSVDVYALDGEVCALAGTEIRTRTVEAIRFENPAIRFHLVEPVTTGDAVCLGDGAGTGLRYAVVHPGLQLRLPLTGGAIPLFVDWSQVRSLVVRYPAVLAAAPDGGMWVLDQGDRSFGVQGQILRFDPTDAAAAFSVVVASGGR